MDGVILNIEKRFLEMSQNAADLQGVWGGIIHSRVKEKMHVNMQSYLSFIYYKITDGAPDVLRACADFVL